VTSNGAVVGQVVVNTANAKAPTYTLIAHGLTPNTEYTFGYTASGVNTLGSASTTATGVLVTNGTFPAADVKDLESAQFWVANSLPGSRAIDPIYGFELDNIGWFVAKIACDYSTDGGVTWHESGHSGGITRGNWDEVSLQSLGVPNVVLVKIHVIVVGGRDNTGAEIFNYNYTAGLQKYYYEPYQISGTTLNNNLVWCNGPYYWP
jgi:hypothetical protein